jgi:pimeloyl-ACP methyl ester carboxylesterase
MRPTRWGLVHGFADRGSVWRRLAALLPDQYEPVAPEFSWGPAPHRFDKGSAPSVAKEFGGRLPRVVVAHSQGAYEVLREILASGRDLEEVDVLILVGWVNQAQEQVARMIPAATDDLLRMCQRLVADRARAEGIQHSPARLDWLARYAVRRFQEWDHREMSIGPSVLSKLRCPALIVFGAEDQTVTSAEAEQLCAQLPNAKLSIVEDAGHWPMLEQPERLAECVLTFVEEGS